MISLPIRVSNRPPVQEPSQSDLQAFDKQHIKLSYIVTCYFNLGTPETLIDLLRRYERYSPELLDVIQFVVVDDGSPLAFEVPDFNLNITWLKITEDIAWNLGGARNLGAVYAKCDKIILADLDHEFPEPMLRHAIKMRNPGRRVYRFWRRFRTSGEMRPKPHANSFFMSRARFLRFYGYDEEFCGSYGFFGGWLTQFHRYHGTWLRHFPRRYACISSDQGMKEHDHNLQRDGTRNQQIYLRKRNEAHYWGPEAGHSRLFLNFNWKLMKEQSRPRPKPRINRTWKHLFPFRILFGTYE
jgi:hypothetical protein